MKVIDEETGEETYTFPVTIYNRAGAEYQVPNQEVMDYHLLNGWSVEKPDPEEQIAATAGEAREADIVALSARVATLEKLITGIATEELIKAQGNAMAKMQGEIVKLQKAVEIFGKKPGAVDKVLGA
jgi:hypothetical protein